MTITTHTYYKTSDGKQFLDKEEAELHEEYVIQSSLVEKQYRDKIAAIQIEAARKWYRDI